MKKIIDYLKKIRREADRGDAVLVTTLISIPLLCLCFAFATGISMATWQKTSYISAAQAAATASLQSTQSNGYLGRVTMERFVNEYLSQTGRSTALALGGGGTAAGQGSAAGETETFNSEECSTAIIDGVERKLPYIEVQLDITRSSGETSISTYPYWSEGVNGVLQNPRGGHGTAVDGQQYRVINAKVWEASKNVTWFGVTADTPRDMTCQPYNVDVSAILFGNNEDLSEGEQCFQPDMFPVNPEQVKEINTSPTVVYESPIATCTAPTEVLNKYDIVTVLGTYRTWSYVKYGNDGAEGWVPTSRLSDPSSWTISWDMGCDSYGCGTTTKPLPTSYNWGESKEPIPVESATKPNFNFTGWLQVKCGTSEPATATSKPQDPLIIGFGTKGHLCFKAIFTVKTFFITFDRNGGTAGGQAAKEYAYNADVPVPANATRPGYDSLGWFTHPTNKTGKITTSTIKMPARDIIYYQHYEAKDFTIAIDQGGTVASPGRINGAPSVSYKTNPTQTQTWTLTPPVRVGHEFNGWTVTAPGKVTGNTLTVPAGQFGNVVVKANWIPEVYNIVVNNGSASPATYKFSGNSQTVALTAQVPAGHSFNRWTFATNSSGVPSTISGNTLTIPAGAYGNMRVVGEYTANSYSITLNQNGGSGAAVSNSSYTVASTYDQSRTVTAPTRAGYNFGGWVLSGNSNATVDSSGRIFIPRGSYGNITLTAQWTSKSYTITIDSTGGSAVSAVNWTTKGSAQTITLTNPVLNGASIKGWSIVTNTSGGSSTLNGNKITIPANAYGNIRVKVSWNVTATARIASWTITYSGGVATAKGGFNRTCPSSMTTQYAFSYAVGSTVGHGWDSYFPTTYTHSSNGGTLTFSNRVPWRDGNRSYSSGVRVRCAGGGTAGPWTQTDSPGYWFN